MYNVDYDINLRGADRNTPVGRRQDTTLHRFLEQWSGELRNPSAIGALSKTLKLFQQE